jgi:hypothetical protein
MEKKRKYNYVMHYSYFSHCESLITTKRYENTLHDQREEGACSHSDGKNLKVQIV